MIRTKRSRSEAQAELISLGWELDLETKEWQNGDRVVSFLNYPNIAVFERTYLGHFKGCLTIVEMGLFLDWVNGWYYEVGNEGLE